MGSWKLRRGSGHLAGKWRPVARTALVPKGPGGRRPRVSNDNPHIESHFHTAKYQPDYPGRFASISAARSWFAGFFDWYNAAHHHDGLALFTPEQVFTGEYVEVAARRQLALDASYEAHPERFVHGPPRVKLPPASVTINPPDDAMPTAEHLLRAPVEALSDLRSAAPSRSLAPVICLPGVAAASTGANLLHS